MNLTRDGIHHLGGAGDCVEPKGTLHVLFWQVCECHVHYHLPMGFNQSIRQLMLCSGSDDLWVVINEILANGSFKKLGITVTIEILGKRTSGCPKDSEHRKDTIWWQSLKKKHPIVLGAPVHQNEGILKTTNGKIVDKSYVHMNDIQIEVMCAVKGLTTFGLGDSSKRTKRQGNLPLSTHSPTQLTCWMCLYFQNLWHLIAQWIFSDVQCVLVSELLGVSQGRTAGGEELEWWSRMRTPSWVMVESNTGATIQGGAGTGETLGPEDGLTGSASEQSWEDSEDMLIVEGLGVKEPQQMSVRGAAWEVKRFDWLLSLH